MTRDLRAHPRKEIQVNVVLKFLQDSHQAATTKNISEGGLFMLVKNPDHYPLGELVNVQYENPLKNNALTEKDAVIVRTDNNGIAVAFIDMEAN